MMPARRTPNNSDTITQGSNLRNTARPDGPLTQMGQGRTCGGEHHQAQAGASRHERHNIGGVAVVAQQQQQTRHNNQATANPQQSGTKNPPAPPCPTTPPTPARGALPRE